eukprot:TRINITY_DN45696_c0_g1_i1.p1 TRINITY_DN45696_c0_g1~~TRINITY_DN45696_c0_g1_i1.p1  ORF type:complete len:222 (+),score=42.59 TRINITY_DN45696_c0_g1_i1:43-708(+)
MPPSADLAGEPGLFGQLYAEPTGAPWDIGRPQDELCEAIWRGEVVGPRVLDAGCGAGDNAVLLAQHGFHVTAFDFEAKAVEISRARVENAGRLRGSVTVLQADAFNLAQPEVAAALGGAFDTVVDSAVFHCIGDDAAQRRYVTALTACVRSGGRLLLLACSDKNPDPWVGPPRRISEEHARSFFCEEAGWRVQKVHHCHYYSRETFLDGSYPAILVIADRI